MHIRRGNIESLAGNVLHGWSWNLNDAADKTIHVAVDGVRSGSASASRYRSDLLAAGIGTGNHAFEYLVPNSLLDGCLHTFGLLPPAWEGDAPYCEAKLLCRKMDHALDGRLETVTKSHVHGWVFDRKNPHKHLKVAAFLNGEMISSGQASQFRQDLLGAQIGAGDHGFMLRLGAGVFEGVGQLTLAIRVLEQDEQFEIARCAIPSSNDKIAPSTLGIETMCREIFFPAANNDFSVGQAKREGAGEDGDAVHQPRLFFHSSLKPDELGIIARCPGTVRVSPDLSSSGRLLLALPWMLNLIEADWEVGIDLVLGDSLHFDSSVFMEMGKGRFREIASLKKNSQLGPGVQLVRLKVVSRKLVAVNPDVSCRAVFLSLSTRDAVIIRVVGTSLKRIPPEGSEIPFRKVKSWFLNDLIYLNDNMLDMVRDNKSKWLIEMAATLIKLECFLTASQLMRSVGSMDLWDEEARQKYLSMAVEVASVEGTLSDLLPLLIKNIEITDQDDVLFTAMSHCFRNSGPSDFFAYLPSGRVNRYYIGHSHMTGKLLKQLLYNSENEGSDSQDNLLLASFVKSVSASQYLNLWNKHLARFSLANIACVDTGKKNVLNEIRYEKAVSSTAVYGLVSVIMPVHNSEDTITYAINSILSQTYSEIELLVCDDASDDNSLKVLLSLCDDPRVRIFRSDVNQGPYNIKNALIQKARGNYVAFQDADDFSHPQRIARQVEHLQGTSQKAVVAHWIRLRPSGEIVFFRDQNCQHPCLASLLTHKSIFEEFGGFRSVICGADSEFYEKLRFDTNLELIGVLEQPLVMGLWSSKSLTLRSGLEVTEDGFRSLARRNYAELTSRQRLLGKCIVTDEEIDTSNKAFGIYKSPSPIRCCDHE